MLERVLEHQAPDGAFQTKVFIPRAFGGPDADMWTWIACDAPTLLYAMQAMGLGNDERVRKAGAHLLGLGQQNGFRCAASPDLGRFKGPGRRDEPCPIANVYALKALSLMSGGLDHPTSYRAIEMLLSHWDRRKEKKYYLFAMGSDFRKLKYPFVWYDILHVVEVLSRFPIAFSDARFEEMLDGLISQADEQGCYTATSMYRAWKD